MCIWVPNIISQAHYSRRFLALNSINLLHWHVFYFCCAVGMWAHPIPLAALPKTLICCSNIENKSKLVMRVGEIQTFWQFCGILGCSRCPDTWKGRRLVVFQSEGRGDWYPGFSGLHVRVSLGWCARMSDKALGCGKKRLYECVCVWVLRWSTILSL